MRRGVSKDDPERAIVAGSWTILRDARLCLTLRMRGLLWRQARRGLPTRGPS
jgi:hypothetical protein